MKTTLLIDGDILAYMAAASVETKIDWGDCKSVTVGDPKDAERKLRDDIERLHETLGVQDGVVCLSCPTVDGWRIKVLPSYKQHRDPAAKPQLLGHIKDYIHRNYKVKETPTLEADDVMGILSTHPTLIPGRKIIVSSDKDMKTIPGWLYSPYHGDPVREISLAEADYWHMNQALSGDSTDGYAGCPGIGPGTAAYYLEGCLRTSPYFHEFSRGPRRGTNEQRWREETAAAPWDTVVSLYHKAGLTEADALVQARVSRICRHTDYDYKLKEVKLWEPDLSSKASPL